jgi:hypothetical protein
MANRLKHRISKDGILAFWPALMIDFLKGEFAQRQQIIHFPTIWIPKVTSTKKYGDYIRSNKPSLSNVDLFGCPLFGSHPRAR